MTGPPGHLSKSETEPVHKTKPLIADAMKGVGWAIRLYDLCDRHGWLSAVGSFLADLTN